MILLSLLLLPLLTAAALLPLKKEVVIKRIALTGSVFQLCLTLFLYSAYRSERNNGNLQQFLFQEQYNWFPSFGISFHTGVDGISIAMLLLTSFVALAGVLVSWNIQKMTKEFYLLLLLLSAGAYGFFISLNLIVLFFFLEMAVIPKYLLIIIWGSGKNVYSANKLAILLIGASALIFVGLTGLYFSLPPAVRSFDLITLSQLQIASELQHWTFPLLFTGFGIFSALFPFHTWVPDGHSSAPTAGSMFLAGISMKLGGYGCLRIATYLLPDGAKEYANIILILSTIAILYGAFATMLQEDLKYINAYSSISHCGFVLLGIGMLTKAAINGAVLQMVSHGLMTALFFAVIGMIYERTHTRVMSEMGGLMKVTPFITTTFILAGLCSLGLPGLSGFVAEMKIFSGSWQNTGWIHRTLTILSCASIVITAVYILRAIGQTAMGPLKDASYRYFKDASWNEKTAALLLISGILTIGIAPYWLQELIEPGVEVMRLKMGIN